MVFGKQKGGGRRIAPRQTVEIPASVIALALTRTAVLSDVSSTGARLSGPDIPSEGQDIWIRVGPVDVLASVVWNRGNECGVKFDVPIGTFALHQLASEGNEARFSKITPEQKLAAEDWNFGLAR